MINNQRLTKDLEEVAYTSYLKTSVIEDQRFKIVNRHHFISSLDGEGDENQELKPRSISVLMKEDLNKDV